MTGYARCEGYDDQCSWSWEVRGVNSKGLDVRIRLPAGFEAMESKVRDRTKKRLRRGNISVSLNIEWISQGGAFAVNEKALKSIINILPELSRQVPNAAPATLDGILGLKGIIESQDENESGEILEQLESTVLEGLEDALNAMLSMRADEGERLATVLSVQLDTIEGLVLEAGKLAAVRPDAIRKRLKEQVETLLEDVPSLSSERLEQEAALLMTKADISEELDRLSAHVSAARDLMSQDAAIGRKLDFLCQEFNREANTLCSKSGDVDLTRIGLDLKAMIEQFREQVQNIE